MTELLVWRVHTEEIGQINSDCIRAKGVTKYRHHVPNVFLNRQPVKSSRRVWNVIL